MDEEPVHAFERRLRDVLVRAVDRIPRLEADHRLPSALSEGGPRGRGRQDVGLKLARVSGKVRDAHRARKAAVALCGESGDAGMRAVGRTIHVAGLTLEVALEDLLDSQEPEHLATRPLERDVV